MYYRKILKNFWTGKRYLKFARIVFSQRKNKNFKKLEGSYHLLPHLSIPTNLIESYNKNMFSKEKSRAAKKENE